MRSAHISVPTTEAALLRVIVESNIPNAAMPHRQSVHREARGEQAEPVPSVTGVPESEVSGWKPHARLRRDQGDRAHREQDRASVYVIDASTLPAKISPRSRERVRIVFSVPLWLSAATMSPATSAVISGNAQIDMKNRTTKGVASPVSRM